NGHAVRGSVRVDLSDDAADRIGGLLSRPVTAGSRVLPLDQLDLALRRSSAGRGLVAVVAELTGGPLRDRPSERTAAREDWQRVWTALETDLVRSGLAHLDWVGSWVSWLHSSGSVTRLGPSASSVLRDSVATLALVTPSILTVGERPANRPRLLGELASIATGSAHGLDEGHSPSALVLRAVAIALGEPPPESAAERRALWQGLGVEPDLISGTVITWGLRPPGADRWSAMMRERADLGLVTHLTLHELRRVDCPLTADDAVVHGCENPQIVQAAAEARIERPLICVSGNPSGAGSELARRLRLRYHGDFDWPGLAIAGRLFAGGAEPWRMGAGDYRTAVDTLAPDARLGLTGSAEATPWDPELSATMSLIGIAVHEEALVRVLLGDLE
ncbi:MAG: hypothetical protein JWM76_5132, partial [Pseudonocardiales bacterium]|nr:hypothetical protein [Pseudonocardiales bacterium]